MTRFLLRKGAAQALFASLLCLQPLLLHANASTSTDSSSSSIAPSLASLPPLSLVREGEATAIIVVESGSPLEEVARTLQSTLKKSTGVELPIRSEADQATGTAAIHIGSTGYVRSLGRNVTEGLDEEGFVIQRTDAGNLVILGPGHWGTEFGVYEFMERYLGVRWLMPGPHGEDIPTASSVEIPAEIIAQSPVYLSRQFSGGNDTAVADWSRRNKVRFNRLQRAHNLNRLFPPSRFARSHPSFYPMLDGKRFIPPNDRYHHWQPNFSAPGIVEMAVREISAYFEANPDASSYSLSTNDSPNFDESQASLDRRTGRKNSLGYEDTSNDYFLWANTVVEKVLTRYPDKWFGAYAYTQTLDPPTNLAQLNARLVPHITYERLFWADPELKKADQALTRRWSEVAPTLGWYDYIYGSSYLVPRVWFHLMQEYLQWGAAHNVRFYHGDYGPNWTGEGPKTWLMTRLLWDPERDVDALLDEWYARTAGKAAAPKLREHYALWEKFWTSDILTSPWRKSESEDGVLYMPFPDPSYLLDVSLGLVQRSDQLIQEALALAETPEQQARMERITRMWRFYRASVLLYQQETSAASAPPATEGAALEQIRRAPEMMQLLQERKAALRSFTMDETFFPFYRPLLVGVNWGNSLLWNTLPLITQSPALRAQLEQFASANPAEPSDTPDAASSSLRSSAAALLAAADGQGQPILKNSSFEEGQGTGSALEPWNASIHRTSVGEFLLSEKHALTGRKSVVGKGIKRGLISQSFDFKPGQYYVTVSAYLPEGVQPGNVYIRFWPSGITNREAAYRNYAMALPAQNLPLSPGKWTTLSMPFQIPAGTAKRGTVSVDITNFTADGEIYLDDFAIFRLGPAAR